MSRVVSIHIAQHSGAPTTSVQRVNALSGRGIEGDRFFAAEPTVKVKGAQLTLIEAEALEALERDHGVRLEPGESRRNLVTEGVALNHLVGAVFFVGDVQLRGLKLAEPCTHLQKLTRPGVLKGLIHRGGLEAEILVGGEIAVGSPVRLAQAADVG